MDIRLFIGVILTVWPRGLTRGSAAARLLGPRVRIPPVAWMSVSSYVLCFQVDDSVTG